MQDTMILLKENDLFKSNTNMLSGNDSNYADVIT